MEEQISLFKTAYETLSKKLLSWYTYTIGMLPNFVMAVIVLTIFYLIAKGIRKTLERLLQNVIETKNIIDIISRLVFYLIMTGGIFAALELLDLNKTVTSLLAGAGVIGLALSFAFQDLASNFISGFFITIQKPLKYNDLIETNGYIGIVRQIGLRSITIETLDGLDLIIPSKEIFQNPLTNYTANPGRRINIEVGVSYGEKLPKVDSILRHTAENLPMRDLQRPIRVDFQGFGDSSIDIIVRFWILESDQNSFLDAHSEAIKAIKAAFDEAGITIPFPIRTIDFGIKGGVTLQQALPEALKEAKS
jgi:small-conductance mechanosensitive channel